MNRKMMAYKPPMPPPARPQSKPTPRETRARPEWVSDFSDADKYKLTQAEIIQRKAERQSSHRQAAKEEMAERMRKLQQGIIDEDTRKVYEVSMTSKGIDLNPPLRRNLSQMIAYEREIQVQSREEEQEYGEEGEGDNVQKELKNTQEFIKRMERANKVKSITQAIEILEPSTTKPLNMYSQNSSEAFNKNRSTVLSKSKTQKHLLDLKEELTPLQNIEGTMNFLENLLRPKEQQNESMTLQLPNLSRNIHQELQSFSKEIVGGVYHTDRNHEDMHMMSFEDKKDQSPIPNRQTNILEDNEWSNTIKRMQTMMENKEKEYSQGTRRDFECATQDGRIYQYHEEQEYSSIKYGNMPSLSSLNDLEKEEEFSSKVLKNQFFRQLGHTREDEEPNPRPRIADSEGYNQTSPSMFSLNYSKKEYSLGSSSKENTNRMNFEGDSARSFKREEEIEFSLTLNNSELKIDTDRFFQPIHEEEEYIKSSTKTSTFMRKPKMQNLVQEEEPEERVSTKHVTFKNEMMSRMIQPASRDEDDDFGPSQQAPTSISFNKTLTKQGERRSSYLPPPQKTVLHQPNKQADKIRRLLEQTKSNMSKLVTQKFQIPSSVSLKRQLR